MNMCDFVKRHSITKSQALIRRSYSVKNRNIKFAKWTQEPVTRHVFAAVVHMIHGHKMSMPDHIVHLRVVCRLLSAVQDVMWTFPRSGLVPFSNRLPVRITLCHQRLSSVVLHWYVDLSILWSFQSMLIAFPLIFHRHIVVWKKHIAKGGGIRNVTKALLLQLFDEPM